MKRVIVLMLTIISCLGFTSCKASDNNDSSDNNYVEIINRTYLACSVFDIDEKLLYGDLTGTDKIPVLVTGQDYRLELHIGPGSGFVPYEGIALEYNEQDISVSTFADCFGEVYKVRGLGECENSVLKFTLVSSLNYDNPVECIITFSFQSL